MSAKRKILILAANPSNTDQLRLAAEVREISAGLRLSNKRDVFELEQQWAVRIEDIRRALLDHNPQIIHFSGHGATNGIVVEDENGKAKLVDPQGLSGLFKLFRKQVECVLLNCCYSEAQAKALHEHVNCVIGMNSSITDEAALKFSVGFYDAVGAGRPYDEAFEFGCNAIQLHGIHEHATPVLLIKDSAADEKPKYSKVDTPSLEDIPEENKSAHQLLSTKLKMLMEQYAVEHDVSRKIYLNRQIEEARKDLRWLAK